MSDFVHPRREIGGFRLSSRRTTGSAGTITARVRAKLPEAEVSVAPPARVSERVGMSPIGVCLAEEEHLPDLIAALRTRSLQPERRVLRNALAAARDRGEIAPDADIGAAIEMAVGAYCARHLSGERFAPGWEERIAGATLRNLGG